MRNLVNFRFILKTFYLLLVKSNMYLDKNSVKFQQSENYEDTLWKNVKITLIKNNSWNELISKCAHVFTNFLSKKLQKCDSKFLTAHSVEKRQILSHQIFFRQIISLVTYLVKTLLWRNFCQKYVREFPQFPHSVSHSVKNDIFYLTKKIFRQIN